MRVGVLREAGSGGREHEDDDRDLDEQLAVEPVSELAPHRGGDRRGQQGGGDDPGEGGLVATEVVDDDRERGRDDGRCEHRHEHAEEKPREGDDHSALWRRGVGRCRGGRGRSFSRQGESFVSETGGDDDGAMIDLGQQLIAVNYMPIVDLCQLSASTRVRDRAGDRAAAQPARHRRESSQGGQSASARARKGCRGASGCGIRSRDSVRLAR